MASPTSPNEAKPKEPTRVFISHSWKDKALVRDLEAKLRDAGAEVWVDHRDVNVGDNLPAEISNALRWCNTLLLIWSVSSAESYWVEIEWTNALSLRKKIIPCLLDDTELPPILSHKVYIQMSDVAAGAAQLLQALDSGRPRTATSEHVERTNEHHLIVEERIDTDLKKLTKQPWGLIPVLFMQSCERFSYYGMRAVLFLYMTSAVASGALGLDITHSATVYYFFSLSISIMPLLGGLLGDRVLGTRRAVVVGGVLGTFGYLTLVPHSTFTFYAGLILIVFGTGLLKPNLPVIVGRLYFSKDPRRDGGFCLYYMSLQIGAFVGPLICGALVSSEAFKTFLNSLGLNLVNTWFVAFGAAGLILPIGTFVFLRNNGDAGNPNNEGEVQREPAVAAVPNAKQWKRVAVVLILSVFAVAYWWAFEQGEGLLVGAEDIGRSDFVSLHFNETLSIYWKSILITVLMIIFAPLASIVWIRLRDRQPSSLGKLTLGLLITGGAHLLLIPVLSLISIGRINPAWLVSVYLLEVVGELCVVPTTLSLISRIAPRKLTATMVGFWFLTIMMGSMLAGRLGSDFFKANDAWTLVNLYGVVAAVLLVLAVATFAITPTVRRVISNT
jgi:POT family proton-dependent oligopeptide transporter